MWKLIDVADARPVIVFVVVRTCLTSNIAVELAAIAVVVKRDIPSSASVNVPADDAVLVTTIFETTAVVLAGTVYSVADVNEAAVRAIVLVVVAISYYLSG